MKLKKDKTLPGRMARYRETVRQVDVGRETIDKLDRLGSELAADGSGPLSRRKVLEAVVEAAIRAKWVLTVDKEIRPRGVAVRERGETGIAAKDLETTSPMVCANSTEAVTKSRVIVPSQGPTLPIPALHVTPKSQSTEAMVDPGKVDGRRVPEIPVFDPCRTNVPKPQKKDATCNALVDPTKRLRIEAVDASQEAVEIWDEEGNELCVEFADKDSRKDTLYAAGFRRSKGGYVWRLTVVDKQLQSCRDLTEAFLKGKSTDLNLGEVKFVSSQPTRPGP